MATIAWGTESLAEEPAVSGPNPPAFALAEAKCSEPPAGAPLSFRSTFSISPAIQLSEPQPATVLAAAAPVAAATIPSENLQRMTEPAPTFPAKNPPSAAIAAFEHPDMRSAATAFADVDPPIAPDAPRAAFEVDRFVWPELCEALLEKRAGEFDQLVGQLVTESALGRKVIAITGSRRGDGRTTLTLLLARRLAATAMKVVVVDADFEVPQLAARLGMTLESGWERILADGLPVWDALVESMDDRLTLLPLAPRPASVAAQPPVGEFVANHAAAIREHIGLLRKHFDVVLVDAGAIKAIRADARPRGPLAIANALDAAIMVSDARIMAPGRVGELQRRLAESRIVPLGVAENFCPANSN
ncbi:MAG TPA: cellulose synthase operon protein YhjQ/BcsQ [Pirellulales bacterium]|nr:cellulose synthase operon protein YhjQ/BcsQ [Pirellulales bacterium]